MTKKRFLFLFFQYLREKAYFCMEILALGPVSHKRKDQFKTTTIKFYIYFYGKKCIAERKSRLSA